VLAFNDPVQVVSQHAHGRLPDIAAHVSSPVDLVVAQTLLEGVVDLLIEQAAQRPDSEGVDERAEREDGCSPGLCIVALLPRRQAVADDCPEQLVAHLRNDAPTEGPEASVEAPSDVGERGRRRLGNQLVQLRQDGLIWVLGEIGVAQGFQGFGGFLLDFSCRVLQVLNHHLQQTDLLRQTELNLSQGECVDEVAHAVPHNLTSQPAVELLAVDRRDHVFQLFQQVLGHHFLQEIPLLNSLVHLLELTLVV